MWCFWSRVSHGLSQWTLGIYIVVLLKKLRCLSRSGFILRLELDNSCILDRQVDFVWCSHLVLFCWYLSPLLKARWYCLWTCLNKGFIQDSYAAWRFQSSHQKHLWPLYSFHRVHNGRREANFDHVDIKNDVNTPLSYYQSDGSLCSNLSAYAYRSSMDSLFTRSEYGCVLLISKLVRPASESLDPGEAKQRRDFGISKLHMSANLKLCYSKCGVTSLIFISPRSIRRICWSVWCSGSLDAVGLDRFVD